MKRQFAGRFDWLITAVICFSLLENNILRAQSPAASGQTAPASPSSAGAAQNSAAPPANPAPPPSEAPKRSQADLEKLAAPIALYPDELIAIVLPASAYPLEIVQASRFVKDTNNISKLDQQSWDDNVKAVARFPQVISQMDTNLSWTSDLGDAFINQPKELMDAIQTMRGKAKDSGALKTTEQQVVTVTNTVVTNTVQNQTVYVTNQIVQIQPAQPEVIYVPQYNPTVVYAGYPVAYPGYYYPPYYPGTVAAASIVSFGAGMAMGAWMANGCNWGGGHVDVHVNNNYNRNVNYSDNRSVNNNRNVNNNRSGNQTWKPDQNRLKNSGSSLSSAQNREARGYGNGQAANRAGTTQAGGQAANRAANGAAGNRAATANAGNRASTANAGTRTPGAGGAQASTANRGGNLSSTGNRSGSAGATQNRATPSRSTSSSGSAFSGGNASSARSSSARGASSRSFSGGGGASRGGGGGGRGGGGRR
ncbi:MAG TPA: DUF3300 domain-containing protein [Verrucomicrobiae bacterium]|nr:DUF3300 domain-containing protein [Verrucomicrobiae bacterium]